MKNIMKMAWEIAYEGVENFGGKVREYFAEALRIAWNLFKSEGNEVKKVKGIVEKVNLPELKGSDKQVAWAKDIRANASRAMQNELFYEEWKEGQPKRPVKNLLAALTSKEAIQKHLNNLPEFLVDGAIESMNNLLDRYARFAEIMKNEDAKFWIDNRDNQEPNYMFGAFKGYVSNGTKRF